MERRPPPRRRQFFPVVAGEVREGPARDVVRNPSLLVVVAQYPLEVPPVPDDDRRFVTRKGRPQTVPNDGAAPPPPDDPEELVRNDDTLAFRSVFFHGLQERRTVETGIDVVPCLPAVFDANGGGGGRAVLSVPVVGPEPVLLAAHALAIAKGCRQDPHGVDVVPDQEGPLRVRGRPVLFAHFAVEGVLDGRRRGLVDPDVEDGHWPLPIRPVGNRRHNPIVAVVAVGFIVVNLEKISIDAQEETQLMPKKKPQNREYASCSTVSQHLSHQPERAQLGRDGVAGVVSALRRGDERAGRRGPDRGDRAELRRRRRDAGVA